MKIWRTILVAAAAAALILLGLTGLLRLGKNDAGEHLVFDNEKYQGLLTVRYFYLPGDKKMGDAILIQSPEGKTMLIDAGTELGGALAVNYLKRLGIEHLDIVLNTHPHEDHVGGIGAVAAFRTIGQYMRTHFAYTDSPYYRNSMKAIENKKIPVQIIEEGTTFYLGDEVKFEVISPPRGFSEKDIVNYEPKTINHYSAVIKMTYKNNSFLFTGDIYKEREYQLLASPWKAQLKADVLDVPHHGNGRTSSSQAFIETVSPKIAVMSQNYGKFHVEHIDPNLIKRYEASNAKVYVTGMHGNILITSNGNELNVYTEYDGTELIHPATGENVNTAAIEK